VLQRDADVDVGVATRARRAGPAQPGGARLAWVRARLTALSPGDRAALAMWAAAHLALLALAWAAAWAFRTSTAHAPLTGVFQHWDADWLRNIAQHGYFASELKPDSVAFFPGFPLALAGAHVILRNWVLAELVVSAVAGCFAVVSLARLAASRRAVLYLVTAPAAIFLLVGYSEALFLALAIPAWLAARRGGWPRAALLAGLAGLVRPDGVFLIPALAVMALTRRGGPRGDQPAPEPADSQSDRWVSAAVMCLALTGPAAYIAYLRAATGSWLAWPHAVQAGWDLHLSSPAETLRLTWWAAFRHPFAAGTAWEFQLELAAMAVMVLATLGFGAARRWPEAVYCGLAVAALGTSTWLQTCPRTLLVLFPVWAALARLDTRWPWIRYAYLGVSAPLAGVLGVLYLAGQWAG
jgi:Mannosyltransferase (PIG-V)